MFCIARFSLAMCICCNETIYLITILYLVWKSDQRIVWKCEYLQKLVELVFGVKGCTWITHSHVISKPITRAFLWILSDFYLIGLSFCSKPEAFGSKRGLYRMNLSQTRWLVCCPRQYSLLFTPYSTFKQWPLITQLGFNYRFLS